MVKETPLLFSKDDAEVLAEDGEGYYRFLCMSRLLQVPLLSLGLVVALRMDAWPLVF